jgi:hypothetical protein
MPLYVYSCPSKHRWHVVHGFHDKVEIFCGECYERMHRVPQTFRWGRNAGQVLLDYMDDQYRKARLRSQRRMRT